MSNGVQKLKTGIEGFDDISEGGLPHNRTTLLCGSAGSAKTVFASQFLANGILKFGQAGVFVTFEESPEDIRQNIKSFGWNISQWEQESKWIFVDASPDPDDNMIFTGEWDMGGLLARIASAVKIVGAERVVLDSLGAVFSRFNQVGLIRLELSKIAAALRRLNVTALMTAERVQEYGEISRFGVEEFVSDNVIILRNVLDEEKRRRTLEVLKFRGTNHQKGEFPFTIHSSKGITLSPLSSIELKQRSSNIRITSGNAELDKMCGGGFYRDSISLVSGATGTGKTLMVTEFISGAYNNNEKVVLFAYEESKDQLFRNASGWGRDFERMEQEGRLLVVAVYPESLSLEKHLIQVKEVIEDFKPNRVAVDSLSALERVSTIRSFREFVIGITSFLKHQEIGVMITATTSALLGGSSITEAHISTVTDLIILLRYVEMFGEMYRGITLLKMRGSAHDKNIREFKIDGKGMHIGQPFRNVTGILAGEPVFVKLGRSEKIRDLFLEDNDLAEEFE